jgi:hypothetical protein
VAQKKSLHEAGNRLLHDWVVTRPVMSQEEQRDNSQNVTLAEEGALLPLTLLWLFQILQTHLKSVKYEELPDALIGWPQMTYSDGGGSTTSRLDVRTVIGDLSQQ